MKNILFILLLISNIMAQNLSVVIDDSYNKHAIEKTIQNIDRLKQEISLLLEKKNRSVYYDRKIKSLKKSLIQKNEKLYGLKEGIKPPFGLKKWHETPFEVIQNICQNKSTTKIGFSFGDLGDIQASNANLNKKDICKNLTKDKIYNLISKYSSGFRELKINTTDHKFDKKTKKWIGVFNKEKWDKLIKKYQKNKIIIIDNNKDRFFFDSNIDSIEIITSYITINNMNYFVEYIFDTNSNLNAKLFLYDKKKLKTSYFKFRNKNYYTYYALTAVRLTCKTDTYDLAKSNFKKISKILFKKYNKYNITTSKIGEYENGYIELNRNGSYYTISYKYTIDNYMFKDMKLKLEQYIIDKQNKNKPNSINQL